MPYTIEVLDEGIVEVIHNGQMKMEHSRASRGEAGALMEARDLRLVLADVRDTEAEASTVEVFEFNTSYYEDFPPYSSVACLISADPEIMEQAAFAETVALNRGIRMRVFLDRDEALGWLREQKRIKRRVPAADTVREPSHR